jgi:hypothetical protein
MDNFKSFHYINVESTCRSSAMRDICIYSICLKISFFLAQFFSVHIHSNDNEYIHIWKLHSYIYIGVSRPGGSLGRRVKMSPRAPAQMGRREAEREGGKTA